LNVISFFYKKLFFSLLLFKIHKKRLRKWLIPCPSTGPKRFLTGLNSFRIRPNRFQQIQKFLQYWIELFDPYPNKFGLVQNHFWTYRSTRHKESVLSIYYYYILSPSANYNFLGAMSNIIAPSCFFELLCNNWLKSLLIISIGITFWIPPVVFVYYCLHCRLSLSIAIVWCLLNIMLLQFIWIEMKKKKQYKQKIKTDCNFKKK
jgi:hypothetical protein